MYVSPACCKKKIIIKIIKIIIQIIIRMIFLNRISIVTNEKVITQRIINCYSYIYTCLTVYTVQYCCICPIIICLVGIVLYTVYILTFAMNSYCSLTPIIRIRILIPPYDTATIWANPDPGVMQLVGIQDIGTLFPP